MEQIGRHVAPAPFQQTVLALAALAGTAWADACSRAASARVAWRGRRRAPALVPYAPVADVAVVASPTGVVVHDLAVGPAGAPSRRWT